MFFLGYTTKFMLLNYVLLGKELFTTYVVNSLLNLAKFWKKVYCVVNYLILILSRFFLEFEDIILLYGLAFDVFNNRFLVVRSVPVLLYNLSVNWYALFYDLKVFLEKFSLSTFSRNRFDSNIVNIFIKHIEKKSVCNLYEVNLFYNELLNSRLNDVDWFDKNCNEVLIKWY